MMRLSLTRCVRGFLLLRVFLCVGKVMIPDVYITVTVGMIAGVGVRVLVRVKVQEHTHGYVGGKMGEWICA